MLFHLTFTHPVFLCVLHDLLEVVDVSLSVRVLEEDAGHVLAGEVGAEHVAHLDIDTEREGAGCDAAGVGKGKGEGEESCDRMRRRQ